jgi:signal transduction histidine kinase
MKVGRENEKVAKHFDILLREIESGNQMIVDLMDFRAPKEPNPSRADLNLLLELVLRQNPAPTQIDLQLQLDPGLPMILLDSEHIKRAIGNILLFEYSMLSAPVVLRIITRYSDQGYIEFIDSGPGLSQDDLDRLFNFRQPDSLSSLHLGLVVARQLLERGGGSLEVESRPGLGTRFSIVLG